LPHKRLPQTCEITLYRIAQEALTNVAKHAQASVVSITVGRQGDDVRMVIEDDGRGFDRTAVGVLPGLGIVGISERAELLGGSLTFESAPTRGTAMFVQIPIGRSDAE
jgi:signal transduction histidine kinase